ncbi:MAG: hypothetical protein JSV42_08320 [Chloroflexota bacterium]|nr:MAG: hypothetical protein JSV42_08320 [Chloroflexota bacterium]
MDRIIKAFTFKTEVYKEVEGDPSFTTTAWLIVAVVSFVNSLGSLSFDNFVSSFLAAILNAVFAVVGFALAAYVINFVGKSVYKADVSFEELVRTVGLAYVWQAVGFLGILGSFSVALSCLVAPALFVGAILFLVSAMLAAKEALDLEWMQTIITVVIGWVVYIIIVAVAGFVVSLLGLGGAALFGLF